MATTKPDPNSVYDLVEVRYESNGKILTKVVSHKSAGFAVTITCAEERINRSQIQEISCQYLFTIEDLD